MDAPTEAHRIEEIEERLLTEDDLRALEEARADVAEGRAVPLS